VNSSFGLVALAPLRRRILVILWFLQDLSSAPVPLLFFPLILYDLVVYDFFIYDITLYDISLHRPW
jgi:hypothetical protein